MLPEFTTGRIAFNQDRANSRDAWSEPDICEKQARMPAIGREDLRAVESIAIAVATRRSRQLRQRRACVRLGHGHCNNVLSGKETRQVTPLLVSRAVFGKCPDRSEISRLHDIRAPWTRERDLLDRNDSVEEGAALPTVCFR